MFLSFSQLAVHSKLHPGHEVRLSSNSFRNMHRIGCSWTQGQWRRSSGERCGVSDELFRKEPCWESDRIVPDKSGCTKPACCRDKCCLGASVHRDSQGPHLGKAQWHIREKHFLPSDDVQWLQRRNTQNSLWEISTIDIFTHSNVLQWPQT